MELKIETAEDWEELVEIVNRERRQGKNCVARDVADLHVVLCVDAPVNATIVLKSIDEDDEEWEEELGDGSVIVV
jgi:hypothetical protein